MAAVKVTITGVICDLYGRTISGPVKIVGEAVYTDLGVGGGPIIPPPSDAHPEHPIVLPPEQPPHPAHPIVLPDDPPTEPPTTPPNPNWVWGFVPDGSGGGDWKPVFIPPEGTGAPH